jgi:hypothetical protein
VLTRRRDRRCRSLQFQSRATSSLGPHGNEFGDYWRHLQQPCEMDSTERLVAASFGRCSRNRTITVLKGSAAPNDYRGLSSSAGKSAMKGRQSFSAIIVVGFGWPCSLAKKKTARCRAPKCPTLFRISKLIFEIFTDACCPPWLIIIARRTSQYPGILKIHPGVSQKSCTLQVTYRLLLSHYLLTLLWCVHDGCQMPVPYIIRKKNPVTPRRVCVCIE